MASKPYLLKIRSGQAVTEVVIVAESAKAARTEGGAQGTVLSCKQASQGFAWSSMSVGDRIIFFQRLSSMLASRVGMSDALDVIYQSFSGIVKEAAYILRQHIIRGSNIHDAMKLAGPRFFPDTIVAIVKTGSQGGDIAYAIREAARFEKELDQVKRESGKGLWSALGGFAAGIITLLGSTLYVAPQIMGSSFIQIGGDGVDIGWVMTMSDITTWVAGSFAALVGGFLFMSIALRPLFPALIDRVTLRIPFYKDMALAKTNYIVFFGLAVLLKAGLRVEEALRLTIESAPRGELRNDLERAWKCITAGSSKPWPFVMTMLHATDKAALATAQDREQTARTIEELALQYQALYRSRMETFVPALQAFSAIFLSFAGFILFAISVIPLMQTSSSIMKML